MLTLIQPIRRGQPFAGMPIFSLAPIAPITVLSVSINSSGSETTVVYSRVASVPDAIGYTLSGITGVTLSSPTGSGSDDTWGFTDSRIILRGESPVLNYSGTGTVDTDNNLLPPFTVFPITNLSQVLPVPTGLIATPGNGLVDLTWDSIDPAQDGERIERSTDGVTFAPIHDKSTDGVTYTDNTAVNGTPYWYRIKTFVTSPALESAGSNVAGPVTPSAGGGGSGNAEGNGAIAVNHNGAVGALIDGAISTTDILRYLHPDNTPVNGLQVSAYLAIEYNLSPPVRRVVGVTRTGVDGRWVAPLMLDPGTYIILADVPGDRYQARSNILVVS